MKSLSPQAISQDVLAEKYLAAGEQSEQELFARVAKALAAVEAPELQAHWEQQFAANLLGVRRVAFVALSHEDRTDLFLKEFQPSGVDRRRNLERVTVHPDMAV